MIDSDLVLGSSGVRYIRVGRLSIGNPSGTSVEKG